MEVFPAAVGLIIRALVVGAVSSGRPYTALPAPAPVSSQPIPLTGPPRPSLDWWAGPVGRFRGIIREPAHAHPQQKLSWGVLDPVGPIGPVGPLPAA